MADYRIYKNQTGTVEGIKVGYNFPALIYHIFGPRQLLREELRYIPARLSLTVLVFLAIHRYIHPMPTSILLIMAIAVVLPPFLYGNIWIEKGLKNQGYTLIHDTRLIPKRELEEPAGTLISEVWKGNLTTVTHMIRSGANINQPGVSGATALDAASIRGDLNAILTLLAAGAPGKTNQ